MLVSVVMVIACCPGSSNLKSVVSGTSLFSVYVTVSVIVSPICGFSFVVNVNSPSIGVALCGYCCLVVVYVVCWNGVVFCVFEGYCSSVFVSACWCGY